MADISKITIESGTYDIKDTTARSDIGTINSSITSINNNIASLQTSLTGITTLKNKKTIILGDSMNLTNGWGYNFITYSGCDGENYGNGSAGFLSQGNTGVYSGMDFQDMLEYIVGTKTQDQLNAIEYLIVGGGINDALNNYAVADLTSAVTSFILYAKNNLPNAKIIIVPINTFKWLKNIELLRYNAIIDTCKNNGVMSTDDLLWWLIPTGDYNSGDNVHLTATGYQVLANNLLTFINGGKLKQVKDLGYTFSSNWSKLIYCYLTLEGNVVSIHACLHYTGGSAPAMNSTIMTFTNSANITGSASFNFFLPALYYASGTYSLGTLQVQSGELKVGNTTTSLSDPYIYVNGSWTIGVGGDD